MKHRSFCKLIGILFIFLFLGCACQHNETIVTTEKEREDKEYPLEITYFELLEIDKDQIDRIEFYYEPLGLPEEFEKRLVCELRKNEPADQEQFDLTLSTFDCQLRRYNQVDWETNHDKYQINNLQAVFYVGDEAYYAPIMDVYERGANGPRVHSWVVADDQMVYTVQGLPGKITDTVLPYDRGLGVRVFACAGYRTIYDVALQLRYSKYEQDESLEILKDPEIRNLHIDRSPRNGYSAWSSITGIVVKSDYVVRGKIVEVEKEGGSNFSEETYIIEVEQAFKGDCEEGDKLEFSDGRGYNWEHQIYYPRLNDSERALVEGGEYLFFLMESSVVNMGLVPAEPFYGICQIIDDQVWPICNVYPKTAWVYGQTLEELLAETASE